MGHEPEGSTGNLVSGVELGPRAKEFVSSCLHSNPKLYISLWAIALLCASSTCVIAVYHYVRLKQRAPISLQRSYYRIFVLFAPLYSVSAAVSLFGPRVYLLSFLAQWFFEAIILSTFGTVMFMLLAQESRLYEATIHQDDGKTGIARAIIRALSAQGPKKHWGVPPFGCFFLPCMRPVDLSAYDLRAVSFIIRQSVYCKAICAPIMMWSLLSLAPDDHRNVSQTLNWTTKFSAFLSIYGLMVMYKSTHDLLHHWNTTRKFVALKVIIAVSALQELIVSKVVTADRFAHLTEGSCLLLDHAEGKEKFLIVEHFWTQFLTCVETVILAVMVLKAFPAEEVKDFREAHLDLVEVELAQLHREESIRSKRLEELGSSSETGSEEDRGESSDEVRA